MGASQRKKQTNKQTNKQTKTKTKKTKKRGFILPGLTRYASNRYLGDPDLMYYNLYHLKQYQYSQHPILWVILNISAK